MKHIFRITKEIADVRGDDGYARFYVNTDTDRASLTETEPEEITAAVLAVWDRNSPSQLDRIEAQTMYTALMTDTLIEEEI